jgi:hypothetical protein
MFCRKIPKKKKQQSNISYCKYMIRYFQGCIINTLKDQTLKLSIRDCFPESLTCLLAHNSMSLSVISFPFERNLRFFSSCRILNRINCQRKAGEEGVTYHMLNWTSTRLKYYVQKNVRKNGRLII